jgi:hypothetical protein
MYEGQIVATRRNAAIPMTDSVSAMQQMQNSLETSQTAMKDTVQVNAIAEKSSAIKPVQQKQPKAVLKRGK